MYSLGAIVHNNEELHRLESKGLKVIGRKDLSDLPANTTVLIRAHGEPPSTYEIAASRNIDLLECTCPVVLQLQKKIKQEYARIRPDNGKILILEKGLGKWKFYRSGGRRCHRSGKLQGSG